MNALAASSSSARPLFALAAIAVLLSLVVGCEKPGMDSYTAGVLAADDGDYLEARSSLTVATDQNPQFAEAWLALGVVYLKLADEEVRRDEASPQSHEVRNLFDKAYLALTRARKLIEEGKTMTVRNYTDDRKLEIVQDRIKALKAHYAQANQELPDPNAELN